MIRNKLSQIIRDHLEEMELSPPDTVEVQHPRVKDHGDFSTNVAMVLAKQAKLKPPQIAQKLAKSLEGERALFKKVEVKGPGFINFFLQDCAYHDTLRQIWDSNHHLILPKQGMGRKVLIEFVSANPTGPMHVGHGRNAVVGDCLARLMEKVGYEVTREFYINDHGVQIKTLGTSGSHYHRVKAKVGGVNAALPEDMYQGAYLETLVEEMKEKIEPIHEDPMAIGKLLGVELLEKIKGDLKDLGVVFDHYFSESSLYEAGEIEEVLDILNKGNLSYEKEGALWFRSTDYGDDKDRVLIKNDNSYTYLTPDIAYHKDKFDREMDLYINVMGADHGGYVGRLKAAVRALGFDPDRLEFLLMQLVNLKRGEEKVSMSKRTGDYVTLREVLEEVGRDATRFFFMMRSHNAPLDFDLELAKSQTPENPVFYIQYAHARMCSIFRKAHEAGTELPDDLEQVDLTPLTLPEEMEIIKAILTYPEILTQASGIREPHRIAFYLQDLAKLFQNYYTRAKTDGRYRVLASEKEARLAKLALIKILREVFRLGLDILGVSAPEQMERGDLEEG